MRLREEKRKPEILDPTAYDAENPVYTRRKKTKQEREKDKEKKPVEVSSGQSIAFVEDVFSSVGFSEESKCLLCGGGREEGIKMTKGIPSLGDLFVSPPAEDEDLHLEEDLGLYFSKKDSSGSLSSQTTNVLDKDGGWASVYGLEIGVKNDAFVHLTCALFSPLTWLKSNNQWSNVKSEVIRSRYFKCCSCGLKGATVGCYHSNCRQITHIPCALRQGWKPTLSNKAYYCPTHLKTVKEEDVGNIKDSQIDISRGYEPLPVTMERCSCLGCNNAAPPPARVRDIGFTYITQNLDHEDVTSSSSKMSAISYFCDTCSLSDNQITSCNSISSHGDPHICPCAYQGIEMASGDTRNLNKFERNISLSAEDVCDGSTADYRVRFECGLRCSCSMSNREVGRGLQRYLHIFAIHEESNQSLPLSCKDVEYGVCSLSFIPKGSFVCEVIGQYRYMTSIIVDEGDQQVKTRIISLRKWCQGAYLWHDRWTPQQHHNEFSFVPDDIYLDCREFGNVSRFIRHHLQDISPSLISNLNRKIVYIDRSNLDFPRLALFAKKDIYPGEELVM